MTLPWYYEALIMGLSLVLVAMYTVIVVRTGREYHRDGPRVGWRLAARIATLVACAGLLISALGFLTEAPTGQQIANFGLGIVRIGLFAGGIALLIESRIPNDH